jgi:aspartate/methionine/tyrosine aminotransferase
MKPFSHAAVTMRPSGIREVLDLALAHPGTLRLEIGEPDFATPPHVLEAAARAAANGFTKYTANRGILSVREAIQAKLADRNGIHAELDQIVVTAGGGNALIETLMVLVDPGEGILLPDPAWPNYEMMAAALNAVPIRYGLDRANDFQPDLDELARLCRDPRAKVILVNSPGNPTGAVWPRETLESVLEIAAANDLYLVSDEVYDEIVFEGEHWSPATADDDGRVVTIFSTSKTYAMTGWRVGYLVAAPEIAELLAKVQEPIVSCATAVAQKAAEAALTGPQDAVREMREAYRRRRDATVPQLRASDLLVTVPRGAFYIFADVGRATLDTHEFCRRLVIQNGVAVGPGDTFGSRASGLVRISLAAGDDVLSEGVSRLALAVEEWTPAATARA